MNVVEKVIQVECVEKKGTQQLNCTIMQQNGSEDIKINNVNYIYSGHPLHSINVKNGLKGRFMQIAFEEGRCSIIEMPNNQKDINCQETDD